MEVTLERIEVPRNKSACTLCVFFNHDERICDLQDASVKLVENVFPCEEYDDEGNLTKTYIWRRRGTS